MRERERERQREREREKEIEAGILWRGGVGEGTSEGYGGCEWKGDEGQEWRWGGERRRGWEKGGEKRERAVGPKGWFLLPVFIS